MYISFTPQRIKAAVGNKMKQNLRNRDPGNLQIRLEQWEKLEGS